MAISAAPAAAEARSNAYRLRLAPNRVYACRFCREAVRVTSTRYLPESCPNCATATWAADGRCANRVDCAAERRPGSGDRSHCHVCGYSVWTPIALRG